MILVAVEDENVQWSAVLAKILQRCKVGVDNEPDLHERMMHYKRGLGRKSSVLQKKTEFLMVI
jgi:hypothetical protein